MGHFCQWHGGKPGDRIGNVRACAAAADQASLTDLFRQAINICDQDRTTGKPRFQSDLAERFMQRRDNHCIDIGEKGTDIGYFADQSDIVSLTCGLCQLVL